MSEEILSRADATWLHAEEPTNHFVVTSLALLDEPLDLRRFEKMLRRRIGLHPRLRQVVSDPVLPVVPQRWRPAPNFEIGAHLHRVALPGQAGRRELEELVGDLIGQPLDFGRPLWDVYAVEGPGSGGSLVSRFHHSLGDGQAMVRMLLTLTDDAPDGWRRAPHRVPHPARPGAAAPLGVRAGAARLVAQLPRVPAAARRGADFAGTLARLTLLDPDRATPIRGSLSLRKAVAWADPLPLPLVMETARLTGTTVNDVVVGALSGALGEYLRSVGQGTDGLRIRAMVPVDLRAATDTGMTGNRFSLVYLELPVGVMNPWERLMRVKLEMDRIKASPEPAVGWLLVWGMGLLPTTLERLTAGFYGSKASLVLTNVIGPRHPLYLAGSRIREMSFWEPQAGGLGLGISIFSYSGQVTVGVVADRNLVAQPGLLTDAFLASFADLARAAGAEPPGVALGVTAE